MQFLLGLSMLEMEMCLRGLILLEKLPHYFLNTFEHSIGSGWNLCVNCTRKQPERYSVVDLITTWSLGRLESVIIPRCGWDDVSESSDWLDPANHEFRICRQNWSRTEHNLLSSDDIRRGLAILVAPKTEREGWVPIFQHKPTHSRQIIRLSSRNKIPHQVIRPTFEPAELIPNGTQFVVILAMLVARKTETGS